VFERSKESLLQSIADEPVGFFDLAVGLGMCHRCILDLDAELFGEVLKLTRGDISAVVGDGDRDCLDPLGELVDGD
jgi:hypothetical protein